MSDPVQLALIAAVTALIGGLPATFAAYSALQQGKRNAAATEELKANSKDVKADVKVIHAQTNSTASDLAKVLAVSQEKNVGLEKLVAMLQEREKLELAKQSVPHGYKPEVVDANGKSTEKENRPAESSLVDAQGDRIEHTVVDTGKDVKDVKKGVQAVEKHLGDRVEEVASDLNAKLDEKRDKDK